MATPKPPQCYPKATLRLPLGECRRQKGECRMEGPAAPGVRWKAECSNSDAAGGGRRMPVAAYNIQSPRCFQWNGALEKLRQERHVYSRWVLKHAPSSVRSGISLRERGAKLVQLHHFHTCRSCRSLSPAAAARAKDMALLTELPQKHRPSPLGTAGNLRWICNKW